MTSDTRDIIRKIRFNSSELDRANSRAESAGLKLNTYIRTSSLQSNITPRDDKALKEFNVHMNRANRDLNTIAHHCNKYRGSADRVQTLKLLIEIERDLKAIRAALTQPPSSEDE